MKWHKIESELYRDFALRTNNDELVIFISRNKNKTYNARIYKPFDDRNIFRSLVSEYLECETLESIKFLSMLKAKEFGWEVDLLDKTNLSYL